MGLLDDFLLAVALAMDCFSVSLTCGIVQKRMGRQVLAMALAFGFFQALMPFIGWVAIDLLSEQIVSFDHWIAFVLLVFLGGRMIWNGFKGDEEGAQHFNPSRPMTILTLAVATSIDALAVGFSFSGMGIRTLGDAALPLLIIGLVSAVMSLLGKFIGVRIGHRIKFPAEPIGGLILVAIGVKTLLQHLNF